MVGAVIMDLLWCSFAAEAVKEKAENASRDHNFLFLFCPSWARLYTQKNVRG